VFFTKEDYLKALKNMRYEKEITLKPKAKHRIILWFRNDLRVHDSGIINWAMNQKTEVGHKEVIPVYCFDPRLFNKGVKEFDTQRSAGIVKTKFQLETVNELRANLNVLGSDLFVAHEKPEVFLKSLLAPDMINTIVY